MEADFNGVEGPDDATAREIYRRLVKLASTSKGRSLWNSIQKLGPDDALRQARVAEFIEILEVPEARQGGS